MVAKAYQFLNLDYLDMMTDGDSEMRQTMLGMLLDELPAETEKIIQLIENQDWAELREVSHKMKSTLAFIGNDDMTEANREIEHITKNDSGYERLSRLAVVLENTLPKVMEDLLDCAKGDYYD